MPLGLYSTRYDVIECRPCGSARLSVFAVFRWIVTVVGLLGPRGVLARQDDRGARVAVLGPLLGGSVRLSASNFGLVPVAISPSLAHL